jgi:hypothetical protein
MNNSILEYKFRAINGYDVILSGKKDAQCFNLNINIINSFLSSSFNKDLNHLTPNYIHEDGKCMEECVNSIKNFINNNIKTSFSFITSGQIISFTFQTDRNKKSTLQIGDKSIIINSNSQDRIESMYSNRFYFGSNRKIRYGYLLTDAMGMNGYQEKKDFEKCFNEIVAHVGGKQEGGKKKSRKSKTRKITKKSKVRKMTGGENEEIKETFQRSPVMGIKPYDLTISTTNRKINLEIKITSDMVPFKKFKESFSELLIPKGNSNVVNITRIKELFDEKIMKTSFARTEFVKNGQTILFEFDLNSDNSKVTIGDKSIAIKTDFKDVLFNLFSNNSKKLLKVRNNGKTFKNVVSKITNRKKNNKIEDN